MPARPTAHADDSSRLAPALTLAIVAAVAVAYSNSFHVPFLLDDRRNIIDNPFIRQIWPIWQAMQAPPQSGVAGRPVVSLSLALNHAISGLDVWSYHLFNIAVHVCCALLVFTIAGRALRTIRPAALSPRGCTLAAFAASLLWALHPIQTMCVTYVIQRAESLMALFLLLTLYASMRSIRPDRRWRWDAVAIISCALGMGCKEVMVVAPCLVFVFDRVLFFPILRTQWQARRWLYLGLASTWLILIALNYSGPRGESAGSGLAGITPLQYLQTQPEVLLLYLLKSVWPHPLCLDYDWQIEHRLMFIAAPAAIVAALAILTAYGVIRRRPLALLGAWFLLILAPTSSFVPISVVASEHRMHLLLAAICLAAIMTAHWIIERLRPGRRNSPLKSLAVGLAATALAVITFNRNRIYQSPLAIWSDVVAQRPANLRARNNLGNELRRATRQEEAVEQYRQVLSSDPAQFDAAYNLGVAWLDLNRLDEALAALRTAVNLRPEDPLAQCLLGHILRRLDRPREAVDHLQQSLTLKPNFARAQSELAIALAYAGHLDDALPPLRAAVRPDQNNGDTLAALAWTLATHPDPAKRSPPTALALAQRAVALTNSADPCALDALAAAHAQSGDFPAAIDAATRAESLATSTGRATLAAEIRRRLDLYRRSAPFQLDKSN